MYYEINISKDGKHFFATNQRSLTTENDFNVVLKSMKERFLASDGYKIIASVHEEVGHQINVDER